ncbi:class I SAM-dependent methyltransferase [Synechocystis sp. LKSZ1]|uniref:class I SAM-dependent methyltransferase n=1 Tax=Synechocystis sp. LKSZ1 TaxID=3144951 RepID=UPI00336C0A3C
MERKLEAEVMDTLEEAMDYDAMDFTAVNTAFAQRAVELGPERAMILDAGTGTARIPILIAQLRPAWQIVAIDLAQSMLALAENNVVAAGCQGQIRLEFVDAKLLPYANASFDGVISNSLLHHLPNPLPFLRELKRVLKPDGFILLRDLQRPQTPDQLETYLEKVDDYNAHQTQLFRDSLQAAFTLTEVEALLQVAQIPGLEIYRSSDYHWTAERPYQLA